MSISARTFHAGEPFQLLRGMCYEKDAVEKIDPQQDHLKLWQFSVGREVKFRGKSYKVLRHTTLASGEPALVLQGQGEQFVIGATALLAGAEAPQ
jgi:hypothetical protein